MNLNKLRVMILKHEFSAKELILSQGERDAIARARTMPLSSKEWAKTTDSSMQRACNQLAKLEKKGYLESKVIAVPGHNSYKAYSVPRALRKLL